ncbi:hypothetical protein Btaycd_013690, partial [Bartonella taylorii]
MISTPASPHICLLYTS